MILNGNVSSELFLPNAVVKRFNNVLFEILKNHQDAAALFAQANMSVDVFDYEFINLTQLIFNQLIFKQTNV